MKKIIIGVVLLLVLMSGCATVKVSDNYLSPTGAPTVVIIGGAHSTEADLALLKNAFPGAITIVPDKYYPLSFGASTVLNQIREKSANGRLILVGHSWGGLIARQIDVLNPGLVVAVVTIATPSGNFRFTPEAISRMALRPGDENSETPLYVIAGIQKNATHRWWHRTNRSDGVVDVTSALALDKRKPAEVKIFEGELTEHCELLGNPRVIAQVKTWLMPELAIQVAKK